MDTFLTSKKRKVVREHKARAVPSHSPVNGSIHACEYTTDKKLAVLISIFEDRPAEELLEALLQSHGSTEQATNALLNETRSIPASSKRRASTGGVQSSLTFLKSPEKDKAVTSNVSRPLTRRGRTVTLYDPVSIAANTPCSIIHNFLPHDLANDLLQELIPETTTFTSLPLKIFENVVHSPHTAAFFVDDAENPTFMTNKDEYLYNGSSLGDVRSLTPLMRRVKDFVREAVNTEMQKRIISHYTSGQKLKYMAKDKWQPNAAFVNCYDGPQSSVGWHTDQLTYLGPHPVIGSLSLGVQREFRIRRIVSKSEEMEKDKKLRSEAGDAAGQISIPLPHNSLLVMHAEMQEQWKHAIVPASSASGGITPHPIAGRKRINVTYRWYRPEFTPDQTPRCGCGIGCVLKFVRGKYMWICQTSGRVIRNDSGSYDVAGEGCNYWRPAEFDDDGVPLNTNRLLVEKDTRSEW